MSQSHFCTTYMEHTMIRLSSSGRFLRHFHGQNLKINMWGFFKWQQRCYDREFFLSHTVLGRGRVMSERCDNAHHMLHRIWKRIRFCLCRTGMIMRKTAIRRQRKNTMVWTIMPAGERSKLQGLKSYTLSSIKQIYTAHPFLPKETIWNTTSNV